MTMSQWKLIGGAVIAILFTGLLAVQVTSCRKKQATDAQTQADIAKGEANAHQTQAKASDAKVADLQAKLDTKGQDLARLQKERDGLLRKLASNPGSHRVVGHPGDPGGESVVDGRDSLISDLQAVVAKDAEVIDSQTTVITDQKTVILALTTSRDEWKATAESREKQAMAQEAATKAWQKAVVSAQWSGGFKGFALGIVLGYAGRGKL